MPSDNASSFVLAIIIGMSILLLVFWLGHWTGRSGHRRPRRHSNELSIPAVQIKLVPKKPDYAMLWKTLSRSEKRVATLAAQDKSNKEIADELHISVRTVESHISKALFKLQISSRHELEHILEQIKA